MFNEKILVVLLGSSNSWKYLTLVASDLRMVGYRVVLLEEHPDSPADPDTVGKFRDLLSFSPDYFISFFLKESTSYDALRVELEMLVSKYKKSLRKKLLVLHNGFVFKKESSFVESLFNMCVPVLFDDSKFYSRSSKLIHKFIIDNERQRESSLVKRLVNLFGNKAGSEIAKWLKLSPKRLNLQENRERGAHRNRKDTFGLVYFNPLVFFLD